MNDSLEEKLPKNWSVAPLGDLVEILDRFRIPVNKEERAKRPGPIPYYGATGQVGWIDDYIFDREIVLLGEDGAPFLDAAKPKAYLVRGKSWVNNHAHVLVGSKGILNSFLLHQLNQVDYRQFVSGTTRLKLPQAQMVSIPIRIAPEEEQKRIVEEIEKQLSRLDAATVALRQVHSNLKRYRESVLKAACQGRLVPTEAELARAEGRGYELTGRLLDSEVQSKHFDPEESSGPEPIPSGLPQGWSWTTIEQLTPIGRPCAYGVLQPGANLNDGVIFIRVGDINEGQVDRGALKRIDPFIAAKYPRTRLQGGEVLITLVGAIGRTAVVPYDLAGANTARAVGVIPLNDLIDPRWVEIWLRNPRMRAEMTSKAHEVARKTLNLEDVRRAPVALPPRPEQERIVAEVERQSSSLEELERSVEASLARADILRQVILQQAFEGKLVPSFSTGESASLLLERIHQSRATEDLRPRRGTGIKPGASAPGADAQTSPKPRRGAGSVRDSASAPSGPLEELEAPSLGLKPQALRLGPFGAEDPAQKVSVGRRDDERTPAGDDGQDFLALSRDEQIDLVWYALFGLGPVEKDEAIRTAAFCLRDDGRAWFQRLRAGGPLYEAIASAIDQGVREGSFDRPRRGHVRALLRDARDYGRDDWRQCLLESLNHEAVPEADALRAAAEWARENLGLQFARLRKDGVILEGLRAALRRAVRKGEVTRMRGLVARSPEPPSEET